jgi:hypothetical protein
VTVTAAGPTEERTAVERWHDIPRAWRVALVVAAAVVATELALSLVGGIVGSAPAGSGTSSSFGTGPSGVAAYAQLLGEHGHPLTRSTRPVSATDLPPGSTLVVLDPTSWTRADTTAVSGLLRQGGHVVLAGNPPGDGLLAALFGPGRLPQWRSPSSGPAHPVASAPVVAGVGSVSSGPTGSLVPAGRAVPVLAGRSRTFAVADDTAVQPPAVLLASSAPLTNALLADRDNAALGLNLAGPSGGRVVFDEYDHGYGHTGGGLAGLPDWWRWGLGLALASVVVWMLSAARRFGPVERSTRELIPPRIAYADALASALAALPEARLTDTVQPLRAEARTLLCRRSGVPPSTEDAELAAAAHGAGLPGPVVASVLDRPSSGPEVVALGRALAWLESHGGGSR